MYHGGRYNTFVLFSRLRIGCIATWQNLWGRVPPLYIILYAHRQLDYRNKGLQKVQIICLPFLAIIILKCLCMPAKKLLKISVSQTKFWTLMRGLEKKLKLCLEKFSAAEERNIYRQRQLTALNYFKPFPIQMWNISKRLP